MSILLLFSVKKGRYKLKAIRQLIVIWEIFHPLTFFMTSIILGLVIKLPFQVAKTKVVAIVNTLSKFPCQLYALDPPGHLFRYAKNIKAVSTVNIVAPDKENLLLEKTVVYESLFYVNYVYTWFCV